MRGKSLQADGLEIAQEVVAWFPGEPGMDPANILPTLLGLKRSKAPPKLRQTTLKQVPVHIPLLPLTSHAI